MAKRVGTKRIGFRSIKNIPIEEASTSSRLLSRQQYNQFNNLEGGNKDIVFSVDGRTFLTINKNGLTVNDGDNDRIFMGFEEGGF